MLFNGSAVRSFRLDPFLEIVRCMRIRCRVVVLVQFLFQRVAAFVCVICQFACFACKPMSICRYANYLFYAGSHAERIAHHMRLLAIGPQS